jgi:hypothetical protein
LLKDDFVAASPPAFPQFTAMTEEYEAANRAQNLFLLGAIAKYLSGQVFPHRL